MRILRLSSLFALFFSMLTHAADAPEQLSARLIGLETFEATFVQYVMDQGGARVQESTGEIRARRPGFFYWHVAPPIEQFVVADGKIVRVYDPDLAQVTEQLMDQRISATPALLLSGDVANLEQSYDITLRALDDGREEYTLKPRDPDTLFEVLQMWFREGVLREMRLVDSLNQRSTILFDNVVVNRPMGDEKFRLSLPAGVDIIPAAH